VRSTSLIVVATDFGQRFINDSSVRQGYMRQTRSVADELRESVRKGLLTPGEAAVECNRLRKSLMEAARLRSSDLGRAQAQALKAAGKLLGELQELYARELYNKAFGSLSQKSWAQVWLEIVDASGRARPSVSLKAVRLGKLGRGLIFLSVGIAVYNVVTADNKRRQVVKEGTGAGGGFVGGAAFALGLDFAFDAWW
jgi:hypothetical protein